MAAKYVRPFCRKQKNDFNDAQAIAEAVTRPAVRYAALKTPAQLDLQALHRVRERLMSQRTGVINQIRAFLLERGIAIRQGWRVLRAELPRALTLTDRLTPRMVHMVEDLAADWRWLDECIAAVSIEIEELAHADDGAVRLMSVPGIGPIISSATVSARGTSLAKAAISLPGLAWCRNRPRPAGTGPGTGRQGQLLAQIRRRIPWSQSFSRTMRSDGGTSSNGAPGTMRRDMTPPYGRRPPGKPARRAAAVELEKRRRQRLIQCHRSRLRALIQCTFYGTYPRRWEGRQWRMARTASLARGPLHGRYR